MRIVVFGNPAPQGSKRFLGRANSGKGIMVESSKAVKPWREAVKYAAINVMDKLLLAELYPLHSASLSVCNPLKTRLIGPVSMRIIFTLPRPKSAPKSRLYPDRKPDLSKLIRSTEDALVDAGVIEDDARIVQFYAVKAYPKSGGETLNRPGAVIIVEEI
ncbi:MAG: hypothetical protein A2W35_06625 [Chloroflexi bacterium RBG_16_57_11]|nr:MAG: hypothetical protein A2W35_06625 [Chloroflexi bacterium RBG_16_57_11]